MPVKRRLDFIGPADFHADHDAGKRERGSTMNQEETWALYAQGKDAWNAWAAERLKVRDLMKADGTWGYFDEQQYRPNAATEKWLESSFATFSSSDDLRAFKNIAFFEGFIFPGNVSFEGANFHGEAYFTTAKFEGAVSFQRAVFEMWAVFRGSAIHYNADFQRTTFQGGVDFGSATFHRFARFEQLQCLDEASFDDASFLSEAYFFDAKFTKIADFSGAVFSGDGHFDRAEFLGRTEFISAIFQSSANFNDTVFSQTANFADVNFRSGASFSQSTFSGFTIFSDAVFHKSADFSAIRSDRAFTLAEATFHGMPDFIQAQFAEAPRLDNMHLRTALSEPVSFWPRCKARAARLIQGDESGPACYRSLKRLAIQGHDHESEMKFFAGEVKSARFVTDYPATWRMWSREAWSGVARFWFGLLYQIVSGFGRSLLRPLALWGATVALATLYFLGQNPDVATVWKSEKSPASPLGIVNYATTSVDAWRYGQPCYAGLRDKTDKPDVRLTGLTEPVRAQTNAAKEAMHLAFRNAFIFLEGGDDTAHRTYGCLYGLERFGDNVVPIVPSDVSFASAVQKAFSGIFIFLFGMGVRNMLRMK
jgi:Pentapeptide repeats (9 copies)